MASQKKIGAYITLDGEKEFRAATTACNKSLATMKSEMKLVEAQTAGSDELSGDVAEKARGIVTDPGGAGTKREGGKRRIKARSGRL